MKRKQELKKYHELISNLIAIEATKLSIRFRELVESTPEDEPIITLAPKGFLELLALRGEKLLGAVKAQNVAAIHGNLADFLYTFVKFRGHAESQIFEDY